MLGLITMLTVIATIPNTALIVARATDVLRQTIMVHQLLIYSAIIPLHHLH